MRIAIKNISTLGILNAPVSAKLIVCNAADSARLLCAALVRFAMGTQMCPVVHQRHWTVTTVGTGKHESFALPTVGGAGCYRLATVRSGRRDTTRRPADG